MLKFSRPSEGVSEWLVASSNQKLSAGLTMTMAVVVEKDLRTFKSRLTDVIWRSAGLNAMFYS